MRSPEHRSKRRHDTGSECEAGSTELSQGVANLIASIKPRALCDSCIALDRHVSYAEAQETVLRGVTTGAFERVLMRCDRCSRVVDATRARAQ
jgi:hypothetical protein